MLVLTLRCFEHTRGAGSRCILPEASHRGGGPVNFETTEGRTRPKVATSYQRMPGVALGGVAVGDLAICQVRSKCDPVVPVESDPPETGLCGVARAVERSRARRARRSGSRGAPGWGVQSASRVGERGSRSLSRRR
jgi:hypothetical protein